jgi:hypothetical protein
LFLFLSFPSSSRYLLFLPFLQVTRESEGETERGRERELDRERRRDLPVESCWTTRNRKREEVSSSFVLLHQTRERIEKG